MKKKTLGEPRAVRATTIPTQKEFLGDLREFLTALQAHGEVHWKFDEQQADPINKFWSQHLSEWIAALAPTDVGGQKARQLEIGFTVARKHAGEDKHQEAVMREAIEKAFQRDREEREHLALTKETDAEFNETTAQIRDGTLQLDTSWIE